MFQLCLRRGGYRDRLWVLLSTTCKKQENTEGKEHSGQDLRAVPRLPTALEGRSQRLQPWTHLLKLQTHLPDSDWEGLRVDPGQALGRENTHSLL